MPGKEVNKKRTKPSAIPKRTTRQKGKNPAPKKKKKAVTNGDHEDKDIVNGGPSQSPSEVKKGESERQRSGGSEREKQDPLVELHEQLILMRRQVETVSYSTSRIGRQHDDVTEFLGNPKMKFQKCEEIKDTRKARESYTRYTDKLKNESLGVSSNLTQSFRVAKKVIKQCLAARQMAELLMADAEASLEGDGAGN